MIRACYELLGLISFFTVGPDEVRAWTMRARRARGGRRGRDPHRPGEGLHPRRGGTPWDELLEAGGRRPPASKGWLRLEGRDYVVQDGDCLEIRFNK